MPSLSSCHASITVYSGPAGNVLDANKHIVDTGIEKCSVLGSVNGSCLSCLILASVICGTYDDCAAVWNVCANAAHNRSNAADDYSCAQIITGLCFLLTSVIAGADNVNACCVAAICLAFVRTKSNASGFVSPRKHTVMCRLVSGTSRMSGWCIAG